MAKRAVRQKFQEERERFFIVPQTEGQKQLLANLQHDSLIVAKGSAGSGKTYISAAYAGMELANHKIDKIILTRPNVSMGRSIGYLPGDLQMKLSPWLQPMISVLELVLGKNVVENQIRLGNIVLQPMETLRGSSWDDTIVLCDEVQNCTLEELKALSTRIGENSKLVLMGDTKQSDLKQASGLEKFCEMCIRHNISDFSVTSFTHRDIVRSGLVKELTIMFEKEDI